MVPPTHRIRSRGSIGADTVAPSFCSRELWKSLKAAHRFTILVDSYLCQVNVKARPASCHQTLMYNLPRALADRRMKCWRVAAECRIELTHTVVDYIIAFWIYRRITRTSLRQVARCRCSKRQGQNRASVGSPRTKEPSGFFRLRHRIIVNVSTNDVTTDSFHSFVGGNILSSISFTVHLIGIEAIPYLYNIHIDTTCRRTDLRYRHDQQRPRTMACTVLTS
jgi:hypothetical protein